MGHTKMVAFRIESYESSPVYVEGRYHLRRLLPIDAERISETWDTAEGRTTFNQYKVTNIKVALDKDLKSKVESNGEIKNDYTNVEENKINKRRRRNRGVKKHFTVASTKVQDSSESEVSESDTSDSDSSKAKQLVQRRPPPPEDTDYPASESDSSDNEMHYT